MRIISIIGPTGVGKSAAALALAHQQLAGGRVEGVDLISADSRQVYQGLEILSGADIPENGELVEKDEYCSYPYFCVDSKPIYLHGVAIVQPTQEWSLAHFYHLAHQVLVAALKKNHSVIVVGGTGLYQTQLLQAQIIDQSPPQPAIREKAEMMSVDQLQHWLWDLDATAAGALNDSDRANPRRLVRAIERVTWRQAAMQSVTTGLSPKEAKIMTNDSEIEKLQRYTQHFFGLQTTKEDLATRVRARVEQRLAQGVVSEVLTLEANLEESNMSLSKIPAHSACGLREVLAFSRGEISREQCVELWTQRELSYAKRQNTWWKKYPDVQWFDVGTIDWQSAFLTAATSFPDDTAV